MAWQKKNFKMLKKFLADHLVDEPSNTLPPIYFGSGKILLMKIEEINNDMWIMSTLDIYYSVANE